MGVNMEDIKDYDDKLIYIIIFNVAFTLLINDPSTFIENNAIISIILTVPILFLPIYVITNIIPSELKFKILYPDNKKHRYAYGIFTRLKNNKLKYNKKLIDMDIIVTNHGIPKTKTKEDDLWYAIYNKHKYDTKIYQQHKQFLFCRDFTTIILIITIIFSILSLKFGFNSFIKTMIEIGICEFVIFWILSRYKNKILVLSVLQEETESLKKMEYKYSTSIPKYFNFKNYT